MALWPLPIITPLQHSSLHTVTPLQLQPVAALASSSRHHISSSPRSPLYTAIQISLSERLPHYNPRKLTQATLYNCTAAPCTQLTRRPTGQPTDGPPFLLSFQLPAILHRLPTPAPPHRPCHHSPATQALPHMPLHPGSASTGSATTGTATHAPPHRLCFHWLRHHRLRLTGPHHRLSSPLALQPSSSLAL
jgi:hypothetical protein